MDIFFKFAFVFHFVGKLSSSTKQWKEKCMKTIVKYKDKSTKQFIQPSVTCALIFIFSIYYYHSIVLGFICRHFHYNRVEGLFCPFL